MSKKQKKWDKLDPEEKMKYAQKLSDRVHERFGDDVPYLIIMGNPNDQFVTTSNLRGANKKDNIGKTKAVVKYMALVAYHLHNLIISSFLNHNPENN